MFKQVKTQYFLALLIIIFSSIFSLLFGIETTQADEINWLTLTENKTSNKSSNKVSNRVSDKIDIEAHSSAQGEIISSLFPFAKEAGQFFWNWNPEKEPKKTSDQVYTDQLGVDVLASTNRFMKNLFIEFDVSNTNNFRKVWFKPTPTVRFRGLFGIHDFSKKRPLVILRMGIHGNVDELIPERFLAKLIYDDLDANFLILENLSSHAFLVKNKNISFAGVDEGLQTFWALHEINKSKLSLITSSVHLVAASMGGHGTFVTALLDQQNGHKIKSILNFCPLINLQPTVEHLLQTSFKNAAIDLWNAWRARAILSTYGNETAFADLWKTIFDFKPRFTAAMFDLLDRDHKPPLITPSELEQLMPNMKWPTGVASGFKRHLENSETFFALNDFWPHYQGVKTPIMIYTTPDDPLVINKLNSELIFRGEQPGDFTSLKYHRLERGIHCGLPAVYQWNYIVKLMKDGLGI